MPAYYYADFQHLVDFEPADLSAEKTERLMEAALGLLNLYGAEIPEPSGTYGSKAFSMEASQWSALVLVTRMFYIDFLEEGSGEFTLQGVEVKARDYLKNPAVVAQIMDLANKARPGDYDNIKLV